MRSGAGIRPLRTVEIGRRILGEEHLATIWAMSNLGAIYVRQSRLAEAEPLLARSFELATQRGGEGHAGTVLFGLRLAMLYRAQERWAEYETLLIRLAEASRRTHGEHHPQTGYIKYWLSTRIEQLTARSKEQEASGDSQGAAATRGRLEELHRAFTGNSQAQKDKTDQFR